MNEDLKLIKMDTEQLEQQVIEQKQQIERIREHVGILFMVILCAIIFFSVLAMCNVFEKKK